MADTQQKLTRIGVFYDGNYFLHVSNYYAYHHERRSRLSIAGLHEFVRQRIADEDAKDFHLAQIVDAHYFRGRLSAQEASAEGNRLFYDRLFDDILMMEGVTTHYLPVRTVAGYRQERGIDVWMALEAFELTLNKQFDVVVLIASDISTPVPLVPGSVFVKRCIEGAAAVCSVIVPIAAMAFCDIFSKSANSATVHGFIIPPDTC
jgi:uncharacterized LabA/DUF88 family protein